MKTTIGGDRLGSGNKQEISARNYERSTHDLSYLWRSSMSAGTLVPFLNKVALPGDNFDIDLNCEIMTLPTIGPLFGSYKVQLDIFEIPMRLYNAKLHMNKLGVGMDMSDIFLPQIELKANNHNDYVATEDDNEHINSSCLLKYLGIGGLGHITGDTNPATREFNAVSLLAMWDVYKNYYANKQEEVGYYIHSDSSVTQYGSEVLSAKWYAADMITEKGDILNNQTSATTVQGDCVIIQLQDRAEPNIELIDIEMDASAENIEDVFVLVEYNRELDQLICTSVQPAYTGNVIKFINTEIPLLYGKDTIGLKEFDLTNIDDMREDILQYAAAGAFVIDETTQEPYSCFLVESGANENLKYSMQFNQEGLPIKTYQSDLFNNWISTEWIDGANGVNELSKVSTLGDEFTIDALNLAQKVYIMLNRIAISGGTYDDWLDAVYTHERVKGVESPVYHGSLIKELAFQEVVSNSASGDEPLGTLAGRGKLTNKNKGGRMKIKVNEPSIILGLVSLTPRVEYSQGNEWHVNLKNYDEFHKPELGAIGFQDLIAEQMLSFATTLNSDTAVLTETSLGKQPAWINYMTEVNRVYGNFAEINKEMFMTLNRRYEKSGAGTIDDATTYIDPTKFNHIFAQTSMDAQNFWTQISVGLTARRKMSAKVIPNL
jgi:hypothetical protein